MAIISCEVITYPSGEQIVEFGTIELPISCHELRMDENLVPYHWHEELELVWAIEGQITVAVGSYKQVLKEGEGMFINTKELHSVWGDSGSKIRSIVFHPRVVGGSTDSIYWQEYIRPLMNNEKMRYSYFDISKDWHTEILRESIDAWTYGVEEPIGYEFKVRSHLSEVILLLHQNCDKNRVVLTEKELRDQERMKVMLQYIDENYMDGITIDTLAKQVMISESECLRCFRSTIGVPPMRYLKQYRVQRATRLLLTTKEKACNIGSMCGFDDNSYFTKVFRQMKGCSPMEYRRRQNDIERKDRNKIKK